MVKSTFSYLEYYAYCIRPKLKEIDLFIKTNPEGLSLVGTANILALSEQEVKRIMEELDIRSINHLTFFKIMESGSSDICRMYKREVEIGSPYSYSKGDISYIYGIDIDTLNSICDNLGIMEITPLTLPGIFAQIAL